MLWLEGEANLHGGDSRLGRTHAATVPCLTGHTWQRASRVTKDTYTNRWWAASPCASTHPSAEEKKKSSLVKVTLKIEISGDQDPLRKTVQLMSLSKMDT